MSEQYVLQILLDLANGKHVPAHERPALKKALRAVERLAQEAVTRLDAQDRADRRRRQAESRVGSVSLFRDVIGQRRAE